MLQTFAILLIFQSIGEVISYALHLPVPGPVIGMILLFGWLVFDDRLLPVIQPTTGELLKHLSLLFVPAGVGIMVHARRIEGEWLPIAVALVLSTWLAIATAALVTRMLMRRAARAEGGKQP
ncbi:CidA/LrgA family protein [Cupriavidus sp. USMAA2-4]|uniref:CidA/LrgA family protein n=1 Tax=Cupriavidus malaysiensis TaxID=367825 RepID=A0ABM6F7D0_9BURK|nr:MULTISPECIES: CidA/LrgA family protein [Cupriavidus]AOY92796.1 CidA/LrgA family protein [Cupriavidus sp. USMAA2-4]AOZ00735.1 CidA/LrgA family protein [Cupriavidus sp. USMAHM13]AOZ07492.1 CidA/LrgA family protein [Cupriavidus malaysiensis]